MLDRGWKKRTMRRLLDARLAPPEGYKNYRARIKVTSLRARHLREVDDEALLPGPLPPRPPRRQKRRPGKPGRRM